MSDPIRPTDEGPEGGLYIDQNDFWVNANGEFVDKDGKKVDKPVKANAPKPDSRPAVGDTGKPAEPARRAVTAEEKAAAEQKAAEQKAEAERAEAERRAKQRP